MEVMPNIEQERLTRLNEGRSIDRRSPQVHNTPVGSTPVSLPYDDLSAKERFDSEQAQALAAQDSMDVDPALSRAVENDNLDSEAFENYKRQLQEITQQMREAKTLVALRILLNKKMAMEKDLGGIAMGEEQRKAVNEMREQVWRGVRVSLPGLSDLVGGWDMGFFSFLADAIYYWTIVKGIKYMNEDEPLKITNIWTPPPMELKPKNAGDLLKRFFFWMVDILGWVWTNINVAVVIGIIAFTFILIFIIYYAFVDRLGGFMNPEIRQFMGVFGTDIITPLLKN